jgi:hypothetical protein
MGLAPGNWESRMTIREIVSQGFHYARTCRSLWLFGFFVGMAGGSSGGGAGGRDGGGVSVGIGGVSVGGSLPDLSVTQIALVAIVIVLAGTVLFVMRFVGEGALIEGVVRARHGGTMTMREGFRAGWAHWGVLVRIALLYLAATIGSVALLAAPCVIAFQALGPLGAVLLGIPAFFIAVPWLVTLYLVQAFAWRIAVLENRHALDAIGKARLFLHGRLEHGLRLIVAAFVGTLAIVLAGLAVVMPLALLLVALIPVLRVLPVIILACVVVLPSMCVWAAIVGTFRSSIWTIGYVTQVES